MNRMIENLYYACPITIQNLFVSIYGYKLYRERYAGNHDKYLEYLDTSQWWPRARLEDVVNSKLVEIYRHAVRAVPFYAEMYRSGTLHADTIRSRHDLHKLPIVSKDMIRNDVRQFVAHTCSARSAVVINTSGTTGKPLSVYVDRDSRRYAYAFFERSKQWAGIAGATPSATFAGRTIVAPDQRQPPYWRKNYVMRNYLFSSYHLSKRNLSSYVGMLDTLRPAYIDSYPSSVYVIARYLLENNIQTIRPKAIITSAETLLEHQRSAIEEAFQCRVYDQYGSAEQVAFVCQCEHGAYHVNPEFGIIEFLDQFGNPVPEGQPGRMVCTGLTNLTMPLIRYDIGDRAIPTDKRCPCGRQFPIIETLLGRTDDILTLADGREVGRLDPVFKRQSSIRESQIILETPSLLRVLIVPAPNYSEKDESLVLWELRKRLGNEIRIEIERTEDIPRTRSGKFRAVISRVSNRN